MKITHYLLATLLTLGMSIGVLQAKETPEISQDIAVTVNINTASAEELASQLKGIGLKKAQAIVADRETNGLFENAEALKRVKGIGDAILQQNEGRILL